MNQFIQLIDSAINGSLAAIFVLIILLCGIKYLTSEPYLFDLSKEFASIKKWWAEINKEKLVEKSEEKLDSPQELVEVELVEEKSDYCHKTFSSKEVFICILGFFGLLFVIFIIGFIIEKIVDG